MQRRDAKYTQKCPPSETMSQPASAATIGSLTHTRQRARQTSVVDKESRTGAAGSSVRGLKCVILFRISPHTSQCMSEPVHGSFCAPLSYLDAGVDIDAGNALIKRIQPLARRTRRDGVLKGIGGFGALFEVPRKYREPVLVSGADGVGTKLKLAAQLGRHAAIGQDLVAMCVNDILTLGAEPLFFLDYFACGKLDVEVAATVINGIAAGCEQAGCALIGGETAEMPGMYPGGEYDLAGFAVGVVEKKAIIDGRSMTAGDIVIGLASSGIHSNGYSLVRRMLERAPIKGIAHITGGGLIENIPRALPESLFAELDACAWPRPPVFEWLREHGQLAETDMQRVFNCGIGMALVVDAGIAHAALTPLLDAGEAAWRIGSIRARQAHEPQVVVRASTHNEARKCHIYPSVFNLITASSPLAVFIYCLRGCFLVLKLNALGYSTLDIYFCASSTFFSPGREYSSSASTP